MMSRIFLFFTFPGLPKGGRDAFSASRPHFYKNLEPTPTT